MPKKEKWILSALITLFVVALIAAAAQVHPTNSKNSFSTSTDSIAIVRLYNPISMGSSRPFEGESSVEDTIDFIHELSENTDVKALILRINSPGGTVGASQELFNAILSFKKKTQVPVIVSIADVGASGAYWIALSGDRIFANPGSMVGSIGVIMNSYDFTEVQKRYGIGQTTYKSVAHKDLLSSWREASTEEKQIIQSMLDNIQAQFVKTLVTHRKLTLTQAKQLADGRIYTGEQALAVHLIDELGTLQDSIDYTTRLTKIKGKPQFISPEEAPIRHLMNLWKGQTLSKIQLQLTAPSPQLQ